IEQAGCDAASLALSCAALPARADRTGSPAAAFHKPTAPLHAHSALRAAARGAWRGAKRFIPDALFLALSHWRHVGRLPNLASPQTFNEFILHRCLHPQPNWSRLADKLAVREFVKERI